MDLPRVHCASCGAAMDDALNVVRSEYISRLEAKVQRLEAEVEAYRNWCSTQSSASLDASRHNALNARCGHTPVAMSLVQHSPNDAARRASMLAVGDGDSSDEEATPASRRRSSVYTFVPMNDSVVTSTSRRSTVSVSRDFESQSTNSPRGSRRRTDHHHQSVTFTSIDVPINTNEECVPSRIVVSCEDEAPPAAHSPPFLSDKTISQYQAFSSPNVAREELLPIVVKGPSPTLGPEVPLQPAADDTCIIVATKEIDDHGCQTAITLTASVGTQTHPDRSAPSSTASHHLEAPPPVTPHLKRPESPKGHAPFARHLGSANSSVTTPHITAASSAGTMSLSTLPRVDSGNHITGTYETRRPNRISSAFSSESRTAFF